MPADASPHYLKHFAEHLVQINKVSSVTFAKPLHLTSGELLVAQGQAFTPEVAERFAAQSEVVNYLEAVRLEPVINAKTLFADLKQMVESSKALNDFAHNHGDFDEIKHCCLHLEAMPALMTQIAVLKYQLPLVYEQALFCAWLGAAMMRQLKRSSGDMFHLFMLCMSHDIGLLHVPIEYVKSRKKFNFKQLRVLQSHTVAGFSVLKLITRVPEDVLKAVMEHHENLDGTGYPIGKVGNTISRFGQWLNFLDAINAIYTKRIKPGERSLRDLVPMIQMNGHSRFGVLGKKLIEWLKELPEPRERAVPNVLMPFLIQAVRDRNAYISSCIDTIDRLANEIGFRHGDQRVFALQNAIIHINISITQSGIINSAYMRWLDQVEAEGLVHAYREVEDVFLMMQEVMYHIDKLKNQIEFFLSTPCESNEVYKLRKGLERLERMVQPKVHPNLEILWIANIH